MAFRKQLVFPVFHFGGHQVGGISEEKELKEEMRESYICPNRFCDYTIFIKNDDPFKVTECPQCEVIIGPVARSADLIEKAVISVSRQVVDKRNEALNGWNNSDYGKDFKKYEDADFRAKALKSRIKQLHRDLYNAESEYAASKCIVKQLSDHHAVALIARKGFVKHLRDIQAVGDTALAKVRRDNVGVLLGTLQSTRRMWLGRDPPIRIIKNKFSVGAEERKFLLGTPGGDGGIGRCFYSSRVWIVRICAVKFSKGSYNGFSDIYRAFVYVNAKAIRSRGVDYGPPCICNGGAVDFCLGINDEIEVELTVDAQNRRAAKPGSARWPNGELVDGFVRCDKCNFRGPRAFRGAADIKRQHDAHSDAAIGPNFIDSKESFCNLSCDNNSHRGHGNCYKKSELISSCDVRSQLSGLGGSVAAPSQFGGSSRASSVYDHVRYSSEEDDDDEIQ